MPPTFIRTTGRKGSSAASAAPLAPVASAHVQCQCALSFVRCNSAAFPFLSSAVTPSGCPAAVVALCQT
ncbi:hypothetical protein T02_9046 [Trichinella nativa]|uniref:Uncharacterized protein n=1 Tax=Trichinella nativa TaxID=6335 RepID=A0A0V1KJJ8_9BILA|nr:hypothetical protein T02_9046 [Trichinella nativa]